MINFGIKDAIDILLVAMGLFYIYKLMKRSSAANVFSGIIVFIIVWIAVTQLFNMRLLGTILDKFVSVGMLALVVIFQEELRRFFSSIAFKPSSFWTFGFIKKHKHTNVQASVLPIVMACNSMSKSKTGALIVIEQNVGLDEYIDSGDLINADINQRLVENIFFKNSPLHDGAMIIRKNRIAAAGCILPVSHNSDIPKSLGLRHRAALGISQKTDAVAVIVSEETGGISVAVNGRFHLAVSVDVLEHMLSSPETIDEE